MSPGAERDPGSQRNVSGERGISADAVYYWIKAGHLAARRGPANRLAITWTPEIETSCRTRITRSGHLNRPKSQPIPAGEAV